LRYFGTYDPKPDVQCDEGCGWQAVEQERFDANLCERHLEEAFQEERADQVVKYAKENLR
jgi:hypothetical protein